MSWKARSLAILVLLAPAPALADGFQADAPTCAGVYGVLAEQKQAMANWAPALARSNLVAIDWAARRRKVLGDSVIYEAASGPYQTAFGMRLTADRINGTAKDTAQVLELSQACDKAFGFTPSFAIPES